MIMQLHEGIHLIVRTKPRRLPHAKCVDELTCEACQTITEKFSWSINTSTIHTRIRIAFIDIYFTISTDEPLWTVTCEVIHPGQTLAAMGTRSRQTHICDMWAVSSLIARLTDAYMCVSINRSFQVLTFCIILARLWETIVHFFAIITPEAATTFATEVWRCEVSGALSSIRASKVWCWCHTLVLFNTNIQTQTKMAAKSRIDVGNKIMDAWCKNVQTYHNAICWFVHDGNSIAFITCYKCFSSVCSYNVVRHKSIRISNNFCISSKI